MPSHRLQGERGRPRHRPDCVFGDRGYDAEAIRQGLRDRRIMPLLAKRNTEHGSGLGRWRWVVERTFAWLNQFRRLRIRYEKRADIHEAFLALGCILICWNALASCAEKKRFGEHLVPYCAYELAVMRRPRTGVDTPLECGWTSSAMFGKRSSAGTNAASHSPP